MSIEDQADIALLNDIGQVPEFHIIVIPGTHAVKEQLAIIDHAHAASGDLQDILDHLNLWQDLNSCSDGIDGPPASGLGQEEAQGCHPAACRSPDGYRSDPCETAGTIFSSSCC